MRYAIVSDIHANLQAWQAVVADCANEGVTHMICLGDVVGYGPEPAETLAAVRRACCGMALGNHDAAAAGVLDPARFTEFAATTARRAALALSAEAKAFLADRPLILLGEGFAATHGSFYLPNSFYYVVTESDANLSFGMQPERALFVGHTHHPCIFEKNEETGRVIKRPPEDFTFRPGCRYLINPGSVGFPREADTRAAYVIYDSLADSIAFRRVPYALDRYRLSVMRHGYHQADYWFLNHEKAEVVAHQQSFSFNPVPTDAPGAAPPIVRAIDFAPRSASRHWGVLLTGLITLFFLFGLSMLVIFALPDDVNIAIPEPAVMGESVAPQMLSSLENWRVSLLAPIPFFQAADGSIDGWRVFLSHRNHQEAAILPQASGRGFHLKNSVKQGSITLEAPVLALAESGIARITLRGEARYRPGTSGEIRFRLTEYTGANSGALDAVRVESARFAPCAQRDIRRVECAFDLDPSTQFIQLAVLAEVTGEVLIEDLVAEPAVRP